MDDALARLTLWVEPPTANQTVLLIITEYPFLHAPLNARQPLAIENVFYLVVK